MKQQNRKMCYFHSNTICVFWCLESVKLNIFKYGNTNALYSLNLKQKTGVTFQPNVFLTDKCNLFVKLQ